MARRERAATPSRPVRAEQPPPAKPAAADRGDDRRRSLVAAAYDLVVAHGFEGLRTRGIAERAGVNIATLHYYFPTKEALIAGVAERLAGEFIGVHATSVPAARSPALTRLRQEFADAKFYRTERPDMLAVIQELSLRAQRDPAIASIVERLMAGWRGGIERMVAQGMQEGVFRTDIDPAIATALIMAVSAGATNAMIEPDKIDQLGAEIERWLAAKPDQPKPDQH
jgi:TetR/AcrR family transcriptional regulator, regulator of cefoperazone and chloramphenicol sensitivity